MQENLRNPSVIGNRALHIPRDLLEKVFRDNGKWTPLDDAMLIACFLHCQNPHSTLALASFCSSRTIMDIKERWQCILKDPKFCRFVLRRIKSIPEGFVGSSFKSVPLNSTEETLLASLPSSTDDRLTKTFRDLLLANPTKFLFARTPAALRRHWRILRKYHLLDNQATESSNGSNSQDHNGKQVAYRPKKNENIAGLLGQIDILEKRTHLLSDEIAICTRELNARKGLHDLTSLGTLAKLTDQHGYQYVMKKNKVTLGRSTRTIKVDFDLRMSNAEVTIPRIIASIEFDPTSQKFYCNNVNPLHYFFVHGMPLFSREKCQLVTGVLIEISDIRLEFETNLFCS